VFLKKIWRLRSYFLVSVFSILCAGVVGGCGYFYNDLVFGTPIQVLASPKLGHYAVLRSGFGIIDYHLKVAVDGTVRYDSGDIWGISPTQLRATLVWDKSGRVIVLEQMGDIKFAFDAVEQRTMSIEELEGYCLSPMPNKYVSAHSEVCKGM
jgi:hypothetical protein